MVFTIEAADRNISFMYREVCCPKLLDYAKAKLSNQGILKCDTAENYFYLKIEDSYILDLFPIFEESGKQEKNRIKLPDYFLPDTYTGAHISVVYPEEVKGKLNVGELGQVFNFSVLSLLEVQVFNKVFYALTVLASDLTLLRNKYNLGNRLKYHGLLVPFHITIAISSLESVLLIN